MKRADQLSREKERKSNSKELAAEFLNGPKLHPGKSTHAKPAVVDASYIDRIYTVIGQYWTYNGILG